MAGIDKTHQALAAEWHPTLNKDLRPADVSAGSGKKVWWICTLHHAWQDTPSHRCGRGSGCPFCVSKRVLVGFNDLEHTHPLIAAEWHPHRNGDLTPEAVSAGSSRKVWWEDDLGHEWPAQINNRTNGNGCPYCAGKAVLSGFNDLSTLEPSIAAEWHPTRNETLAANEIARTSGRKVWWRCRDDHEWQATVGNRTFLGQGCPVCAGQKVLVGLNDMATTSPELAAEWHPTRNLPLTPRDVFRSTARRFWWQDALGHEWEASANERSNGSNCPYCSGQRILPGFNDLATRNPPVAAEWHLTRNGDRTTQMVTLMNGTKAWWLCPDGHEWEAVVSSRSSGTGCPACAGQIVVRGKNDLASRAPKVAATWHPSRNGALAPEVIAVYSNRKAWFLCPEGHEWESTVSNRTHGQGCPECAEYGFNPGRPGYLYFLEHQAFSAFKIGITNVHTSRLEAFRLRGWVVVHLELFEIGAMAAEAERRIKQWWRVDLGLPRWLGASEMRETAGWTETICSDELTAFDCIQRIRAVRADIVRKDPNSRTSVSESTVMPVV